MTRTTAFPDTHCDALQPGCFVLLLTSSLVDLSLEDIVSDIAIFVLKRDVKLQLTNSRRYNEDTPLSSDGRQQPFVATTCRTVQILCAVQILCPVESRLSCTKNDPQIQVRITVLFKCLLA